MRAAMLGIALLTAACSGHDRDDYNEGTTLSAKDRAAEAAIAGTVAQNGVASAQASGLPVTKPTPKALANNGLPAAFQGYWGVAPADCDLTNVNARGRIDIDGDTIRFFDSRARIIRKAHATPYAATVDLAFSGDGAKSTKRTLLKLDAGGTALVRSQEGEPSSVRYRRCS